MVSKDIPSSKNFTTKKNVSGAYAAFHVHVLLQIAREAGTYTPPHAP